VPRLVPPNVFNELFPSDRDREKGRQSTEKNKPPGLTRGEAKNRQIEGGKVHHPQGLVKNQESRKIIIAIC